MTHMQKTDIEGLGIAYIGPTTAILELLFPPRYDSHVILYHWHHYLVRFPTHLSETPHDPTR